MRLQTIPVLSFLSRANLPVDQGAKIVSAASGSVRGHTRGNALIDAHLDSGPNEDKPLIAAHLCLALGQAQHIFPPLYFQHLLLHLHR